MGLIFNEKVAEKWSLWVPCTIHGTHRIDKGAEKSTNYGYYSWTVAVVPQNACATKKKKKRKREMQPPNPNTYLHSTVIFKTLEMVIE